MRNQFGLSQKARWWENLEDEDPITLEPISSLQCPPFELTSDEDSNSTQDKRRFLFDAHVFAEYIVSQVFDCGEFCTNNFVFEGISSGVTHCFCRAVLRIHSHGAHSAAKIACGLTNIYGFIHTPMFAALLPLPLRSPLTFSIPSA